MGGGGGPSRSPVHKQQRRKCRINFLLGWLLQSVFWASVLSVFVTDVGHVGLLLSTAVL